MDSFNILDFDVIADVKDLYQELREELPRLKAIKEVLLSFADELDDYDDKPRVYIGLALAILERGEKIPINLKTEVLTALSSNRFRERFLENEELFDDFLAWCENFKYQVENDISLKKPIKVYKKYDFKKWKKGDLYCFTGEVPESELYRFTEENFKIADLKAVYFYVQDVVMLNKKLAPIVYAYVTKDLDFVKENQWDQLIPLTYTANAMQKGQAIYPGYRYVFIENKFTRNSTYDLQYLGNFSQFVTPATEQDHRILAYCWLGLDNIPCVMMQNLSVMKRCEMFPID